MTWPELACPDCRPAVPLSAERDARLGCPNCRRGFDSLAGLRDFRPQEPRFRQFLDEYEAVREAEGRGSASATPVAELPWARPGDPQAWEWYIRAASFDLLQAQLPSFGESCLRVLDLGAGTAWLSHRLSLLDHRPVAIDLSAHPRHGLAAAEALEPGFPRLLADYDRLPLADGQADLAIFNASLHYSPDLQGSLLEARRVLRPAGAVIVMDSPIYRSQAAGERMVAARKEDYLRRYGFASDALGAREFLLASELLDLGRACALEWTWMQAEYGLSWRLHRLRRRLATGRESAEFALLVGRPA
jgi:SAM-dependent methyltransferase